VRIALPPSSGWKTVMTKIKAAGISENMAPSIKLHGVVSQTTLKKLIKTVLIKVRIM
jgi:hypothetical protein